jgi:RES domain-containing protein
MIIYRLTTGNFANDLSGEGAKIYGGRWNPVGMAALYMSEFISLSILEILVRASKSNSPDTYTLLTVQVPESSIVNIELKKLKNDWQNHMEYTRAIGSDFLKTNQSLTLKVPSAIVPQEHNFLINPVHKDFKKVKIVDSELLELDKRLLQTQ